MILNKEQWADVDSRAKSLAKEYAEGFSEDKYGNGEIHQFDSILEQREYGGNYFILESEISDIIKDVLEEHKALDGDDLYNFDTRMVEGFHDLIIEFEGWLSDLLPNKWYVYYEDGDIWVARHWEDVDEIPSDLKHLVVK